jgi:hypothetical protein
LLVRPDRHIAWRSIDRPQSPEDALRAALRQVLALDMRFDDVSNAKANAVVAG